MKRLKFTAIALAFTVLISCGGGSANAPATAEGFTEIENDIKSKFGDDAYFTDLFISYDESIGNMVVVTVTEDPESLEMGEWTQSQGAWSQTSEVSLEIPDGTKASDFMFQLDDDINLKELGGLIEDAKQRLIDEKSLENPTLSSAAVIFPDDGDRANAFYSITMKPENGGTSFRFYYELSGEFQSMDY